MLLLIKKFDTKSSFLKQLLFTPFDLIYSFLLLTLIFFWFLTRKKHNSKSVDSLLYLDTSYSLQQIRERELDYALYARECDGLFDRVWSINPLVGADPDVKTCDSMSITSVSDVQKFVEISVSNGSVSNNFAFSNFLKSQFKFLKYLYELIKTNQVGVVRTGDPIYLGLVGFWASRITGSPFIIRINSNYDLFYESNKRPAFPRLIRSIYLEKKIIKWVLLRADLIVASSEDNRNYVLSKGVDPKVVKIVGYGSLLNPLHYEDPSLRKGIRGELDIGGRPLISSITRLESSKKVEQILEALAYVVEAKPETVCVIAGDGSLRNSLNQKAIKEGLKENFLLVGNCSQTWLGSLLADSDVLMFPLAGRALVEAALSGTPIVAYDVEWHHEIIQTGISGILVESDNPQMMAKSVLSLLNDKKNSERLAQNLRQKILSEFASEDLIRLERNFVSDLLDRSNASENK